MTEHILVDRDLIKEAMDAILTKNAELEKLAQLTTQLDIHQRVAGLVSKGALDPSDMLDKIAEFAEDPESLLVLEKVSKVYWDNIQTIAPESATDQEASAEEKLFHRLQNI